ncbi:hypothetical protein R1sor_007566 [Riccia sorocarpa]|uniref:Spermatogenesis-associated protein 17 n=1 Tax=Riccia sorocarpa TaxID=122646 RepID=A0ABD3HQU6_9MARC
MVSLNLALIEERTSDILQSYFERAKTAEQNREKETKAAIKIQAAWRRKAVRLQIKRWDRHVTAIQRWYRGHLGRVRALDIRRKKDKMLRLEYFGKRAKTIQRHFRGFMSRKYKHNFYKRKEFIEQMVEAGAEMRETLKDSYNSQMQRETEAAEKSVKGYIDDFITNSHYRVGTEVTKGAFYSPLIAIFGRGRSYLEEHIKDARRRQVTGMELWKKKGYDEYGIPIKVANNKFFIKQSKVPHSKLSIDTRRRVEEAALLSSAIGTYITHVGIGPYVTKQELVRKTIKEKELLNPHTEEFKNYGLHDRTNFNHLTYPSVRMQSEWGQTERLRKEERAQLEKEFPRMVEEPFTLRLPSGKIFDLANNKYYKIFPKRHHHTHNPYGYGDFDYGPGRSFNRGVVKGSDHVRSSMNIDRRHSRRASHEEVHNFYQSLIFISLKGQTSRSDAN